MPAPTVDPAEHDGVLYDSPRTSLASKVAVSLGTGAALAEFMSFMRWFARSSAFGAVTLPMALLGAGVSAVMVIWAIRSTTARRVEVVPARAELCVFRDPGVVETVALSEVATARSEAPPGGWSRDPAEDLVIVLRDGSARRYSLPDDADTPGIVRDLLSLLAEPPLRS